MTFFMWALESTDESWDYGRTPISNEISPTLVPMGEIYIPPIQVNKSLIKHYTSLLEYCREPNKNVRLLNTIPREVFGWLEKFLKYADRNNINASTNRPLLAYCKARKYCT